MSGLVEGQTYHFALKTADEIPNWSQLSNVLATVPLDPTPPPAITDLSIGTVTNSSIQLEWTATSDGKDANGPATEYDIRYSDEELTPGNWDLATQAEGEPPPGGPGFSESFTLTGLAPITQYFFAMRVADEVPNWSDLSNTCSEFTAPNLPPETHVTGGPQEFDGENHWVQIYWSGDDPDGSISGFFTSWEDTFSWTWTTDAEGWFQLPETGAHSFFVAAQDDQGKRDPTPATITVEAYPIPDSADQLMANFRLAYRTMDINGYRNLLHTAFKFIFQDYDIRHLNLPSDHLNRAEDLASTQNMFSGDPIVTPDGTIPGVSQINIDVLDRQTVWTSIPDGDFAGSFRALYNVQMSIQRPGASTIIVGGQTEFYAVAVQIEIGGEWVDTWQLMGQVDLTDTGGKSTETVSWGAVKALYR